jgi:hypothetical protein
VSNDCRCLAVRIDLEDKLDSSTKFRVVVTYCVVSSRTSACYSFLYAEPTTAIKGSEASAERLRIDIPEPNE